MNISFTGIRRHTRKAVAGLVMAFTLAVGIFGVVILVATLNYTFMAITALGDGVSCDTIGSTTICLTYDELVGEAQESFLITVVATIVFMPLFIWSRKLWRQIEAGN